MKQVTISQEAYNALIWAAEQFNQGLDPTIFEEDRLKSLDAAIQEQPTIIPEQFTPEQIDTIIEALLCDGLYFFGGYGFSLDYSEAEYREASKAITKDQSIEDVQKQMLLMGYGLTFTDLEGEGDQTVVLTYDLIKEKLPSCPAKNVQNILNEEYDAEDCDIVLQTILFGSIVYG